MQKSNKALFIGNIFYNEMQLQVLSRAKHKRDTEGQDQIQIKCVFAITLFLKQISVKLAVLSAL